MNKRWLNKPQPIKLSVSDKTRLGDIAKTFIVASPILKEIVHRIEIKAGRVYLYRLHEQFGWDNPEVQFIKTLIDGKYAEFPITLYDVQGNRCEADYQRHTGQWLNLFEGNLTECLTFIEENNQLFQ
jgi:hypothetical protein